MHSLSCHELKSRIDPIYHPLIKNDYYPIETVNASDLLTSNRLDVAAKLLFIDGSARKTHVSRHVYADHIRAFTLGRYKEPGTHSKDSLEVFLHIFEQLYESIQLKGFDEYMSLVPLATNGTILNGSHRVACAIALGMPVRCVRLDCASVRYDYDFFRRRCMSDFHLERCVTKFVEVSCNTYTALIWPAASAREAEISGLIGNIVYKKDVFLTLNGLRNLIAIIYQGQEWLGDRNANYPGITGKLLPCYSDKEPLRIYVFQASSLAEALKIKDQIRGLFKIGKHAVHINDSHGEAVESARTLFNDNAIHFLNYAKPNAYGVTAKHLARFKEWCIINEIDTDHIVLDSGIVLALYGLRPCTDIDFICSDSVNVMCTPDKINTHNETLRFHGKSMETLCHDPSQYFYCDGLKVVSFNQVYDMKRNRGETKDKSDIVIMRSMIENTVVQALRAKLKQRLWYGCIRCYAWTLEVLRIIGLYKVVRSVYRRCIR